jgi:hypothetical protein
MATGYLVLVSDEVDRRVSLFECIDRFLSLFEQRYEPRSRLYRSVASSHDEAERRVFGHERNIERFY